MGKNARRGAARNRRGKAGETLTETLITILIIGLSSVLFLTMIGASGKIYRKADKEYKVIYTKVGETDQVHASGGGDIRTMNVTTNGSATIKVNVSFYGDSDYFLSYQ